jgi:hypothetical protein
MLSIRRHIDTDYDAFETQLAGPDYPSFFAERPLDLGAIHGPAVFGG